MPASSAFRHHVFLPFQLSFGLQDDVDREAKNTRTRKCARRQPASLVGLWSAESLADMRTGSRTLLSLERQPTMFAFLSVSPEHPSTGREGRCSESARCHWMKAPTAPKRPKLAMKNNAYRDGTQHHSNYFIIYILLELVINPASHRWTPSGIEEHVGSPALR